MTTKKASIALAMIATLFLGGCGQGAIDGGPTAAGSGRPGPGSDAPGAYNGPSSSGGGAMGSQSAR